MAGRAARSHSGCCGFPATSRSKHVRSAAYRRPLHLVAAAAGRLVCTEPSPDRHWGVSVQYSTKQVATPTCYRRRDEASVRSVLRQRE